MIKSSFPLNSNEENSCLLCMQISEDKIYQSRWRYINLLWHWAKFVLRWEWKGREMESVLICSIIEHNWSQATAKKLLANTLNKVKRNSVHTALPAPTEHRMEESGEKALQYTQFWCPRKTFTMLPTQDSNNIINHYTMSFTDKITLLPDYEWYFS